MMAVAVAVAVDSVGVPQPFAAATSWLVYV